MVGQKDKQTLVIHTSSIVRNVCIMKFSRIDGKKLQVITVINVYHNLYREPFNTRQSISISFNYSIVDIA